MSETITFDPAQYAGWRATALGEITERLERALIFELAGPLAGKALLDVGTGDGTYALHAASHGARATGVDADPAMLTAARSRAHAMGHDVAFTEGRIKALAFADAQFDVVMAVTVLCFVQDRAAAFREMARVVRPGGLIIVGELGRFNAWAATRRLRGWLGSRTWRAAHFWTSGELRRQMTRAGLVVEAVRGAIYYPPIDHAARLLAPIDPWLSRIGAPGPAFLAVSARKV